MFTKKGRPAVRTITSNKAASNAPHNVHLRSDIGCGMIGCTACSTSAFSGYQPVLIPTMPVMIPDTNIVLHNINALEDTRVTNIVFLGTVLAETMNRNKAVYTRVQRMIADEAKHCYVFSNDRHEQTYCLPQQQRSSGVDEENIATPVAEPPHAAAAAVVESANDYNDRCIRAAAVWLGRHMYPLQQPSTNGASNSNAEEASAASHPSIALVSHDKKLRETFEQELPHAQIVAPSLRCMTLKEFVLQVVTPESDLLEKLQYVVPGEMKEGPSNNRAHGGRIFETHLPLAALEQGVHDGVFHKGKLRVSETNCFFGEIRGKWGNECGGTTQAYDRVLIPGRKNLNRSIHDDIVCVQLLHPCDWKVPQGKKIDPAMMGDEASALSVGCIPCGKVVGILEARRRPYCGSVDVDDAEAAGRATGMVTVLIQPKNNKIPRIRIQTNQLHDIKDKRLAVVIDDWTEFSAFPTGHYIEVLGKIGDRDTEAMVILKEHDIPHYDFSAAVYDCLPKGEWKVEKSELAKRLDLRDLCIVSVDPLGCRDIDDALHCRVVNGNHLEVGVHIADVTHFMHEHTAMDEEAAKRCTSVYLVDRRINMLPQLLTENLCSIVGNEERYAFSILWEFDENFNVVRDWFGKTVIKSRAALYYGDAQKMIDDEHDEGDIAMSLKRLMKISRHFKEQREKDGALFLASQEFKFKVDNEHVNPTDMMTYQTFEANSMIEEWMLYANAAAAKKIYSVYPQWTLLRRHQHPAEGAFTLLNEALKAKVGVTLDDTNSLSLNMSLDRCVDPADPFFNKLVRILTTRCLKQAQYFSSGEYPYDEFQHFGLAMPIYTHFTSPIRRYADVVVHRQLAAAIGILNVSEDHTDRDKMNGVAETINYRHECAQKAGRDSQNLFTGFYLRNFADGNIPNEDGYVVRVSDTHVFVMVPKYGQEGKIAREQVLRVPQLLDKVEVRIIMKRRGDALRTSLEFEIVGNSCVGIADEPNAVADVDVAEPDAKKARTEGEAQ